MGMTYDRVKRAIDVLAAGLLLIILSPLMAMAAFAVWVSSPGPILYRQVRVGRHGVPFEILKFRTMRVGEGPSSCITTAGHLGITRLGVPLRQWKVDELPQLINVLRGEMSLVGPRPEVAKYVNMFREEYREILSVRPGLTDPATVVFRDEEHVLAHVENPERAYVDEILPQKLALARGYVCDRSLRLDAAVLAYTVLAILGWSTSKVMARRMLPAP